MNKKLIFVILLISSISFAKFKFQSNLLMNIHRQLIKRGVVFRKEKAMIDTLETGSYRYIFPSKKFKKGIKFIVTKDSIVCHIGINIFPNENIYSKFIERCILVKNYKLNVNQNFAIDRERTVISYNGRKFNRGLKSKYFADFLNTANSLQIQFENKEVTFNLSDSLGNILRIIAPQDLNYITGMDKKELDDYWLRKIKNSDITSSFSKYSNEIDTNIIPNKLVALNDSIFYLEGKNLINGLDQDIYFFKDSTRYKLVKSKSSPVLSIKNILHFPNLSKINIDKLNFHLYPQRTVVLKKDLVGLDLKLSKECEKFVGFEKKNKNDYMFLILYFNPLFKYSHLLSLKIKSNGNSLSSLLATGDLYTNIRNDNLNNIFKKYETKRKQFVIDIKRGKKEK